MLGARRILMNCVQTSGNSHHVVHHPHTTWTPNKSLGTYPSFHSLTVLGGPLFKYEDLVAAGKLRKDTHQLIALKKLQHLHERILHYDPKTVTDQLSPPTSVKTQHVVFSINNSVS